MRGKRPLVVIVEDDGDLRSVVRDWLAGGYEVMETSDAEHFLELMDDVDHPALIIMDLRLPQPAGAELTRTVRHHPKLEDVPILLMTGSPWDEDFMDALEAGVSGYLPKPVDRREFLGKVAELVASNG